MALAISGGLAGSMFISLRRLDRTSKVEEVDTATRAPERLWLGFKIDVMLRSFTKEAGKQRGSAFAVRRVVWLQ